MAITAADFELPGGIQSYEQFKKAQTAPKFIEERDVNNEMGQKEFLLLFTTQLQNQKLEKVDRHQQLQLVSVNVKENKKKKKGEKLRKETRRYKKD